MWLQPQFNHANGALVGAEALVRWRHPQKGLIQPGSFISVFEQTGFIYELDKYVWEHTCRLLRRWLDAGLNPVHVSVNISRYDVFRSNLIEVITNLVSKYELPVELLRLEITESAFAEAAEQIIDVVKTLQGMGFTVEIDDFGSGYSSLNTLKDVPANGLKLDRRFLEDNGNSQRGGNILSLVVRMAKWLNMEVIAEGVETVEQADFLRSIGCNNIQGYLYSKPLPAQEYEHLLELSTKEVQPKVLTTVAHLDNNAFWNPQSMDTLIFNSYIGGACIFEYNKGNIELLRANQKYVEVIGSAGMTIQDALRLNWSRHLSLEQQEKVVVAIEKSIANDDEVTEEFIFTDLPGSVKNTFLHSSIRVIASAGERYLVYCTNENITAQRVAEEGERRSSERYRAIMSDINSGITAAVLRDGKSKWIFANEAYYRIMGYTREQFAAEITDHTELVFEEDYPYVRDKCLEVFATGKTTTIEYRIRRRDGELRWLRITFSATRFSDIEDAVQLRIITDITDNKRMEKALVEIDEQLQFINATSNELLAEQDSTKAIDDVLAKLLSYFKAERAYIFEYDATRQEADNTYEICAEGISSEKDGLQKLPLEAFEFWLQLFNDKNYVSIDDVAALGPEREHEKRVLLTQNIKALVAVPLRREGKFIGFMGIDNPVCNQQKVDRLAALGDIVTMLLMRRDLQSGIDVANRRLTELLDNLPCGAGVYEFDGKSLLVVHLNRRYSQMVGRCFSNPRKTSAMDSLHPDDRVKAMTELQKAIAEQRYFDCELRILHKQDGYRYYRVVARIETMTMGGYVVYATFTPMSEDSITFSKMLPYALAAVMKYSTELAFVKDKNFRYICCNDTFLNVAGLRSDKEVIGKTDYDFLSMELANRYRAIEEEIFKTGKPVMNFEEQLVFHDGSMRYVNTSKYPLMDADGKVLGVYGISRDITADRLALERLQLFMENVPGGLVSFELLDDGAKVLYFNDSFYKALGYTKEEFDKKIAAYPLFMLVEEDVPKVKAAIEGIRKGEKMQTDCVYRCRTKSGGYRWFSVKGAVADNRGKLKVVDAVQFDITEQKETEERLRVSEEQFRIAAALGDRRVARFDIQKGIYYNEASLILYDQGFGHVIENVPQVFIDTGLVAPTSVKDLWGFVQSLRDGAKSAATVLELRSPNGLYRWYRLEATTIFAADGLPAQAIVVVVDITEEREREAVYKKWQQSIQAKPLASYTMFRCNLSKGVAYDSVEGSLLSFDLREGSESFDMRTQEYAERFVAPEDRAAYIATMHMDTLIANYYRNKRKEIFDYRELLPGDKVRWLRRTIELVEYPDSSDIMAYLLYEDIDEEKRAELQTKEKAEHDPLTGVLNRAAFIEKMNAKLRKRKAGTISVLMMFDIDGFKLVNDNFGHEMGDKALVEVADKLHKILRHDDLLGRLGGDEFFVFLSDVKSRVIVAKKAAQICRALHRSFSVEVQLSVSLGIAISPDDGNSFEDLYSKADLALYHVKAAGKDNCAFFEPGMDSEKPRIEHVQDSIPMVDLPSAKIKRRMLIVEDNKLNRDLLVNVFKDEFIIDTADDGNAALIRLRRYGEGISVVLLDLVMPGMDGFAVLERMRAAKELQNIPVIVVSGLNERDTALRTIRCGASDFVTKPVDVDLLRLRVESAISKAENERLRAQNMYLELQNDENNRLRAVLDSQGTVMAEYDRANDSFKYEPGLAQYIAARFDKRPLWELLRADGAADAATVLQMQALVEQGLSSSELDCCERLVQLATPMGRKQSFLFKVIKRPLDVGTLGERIILSFTEVK